MGGSLPQCVHDVNSAADADYQHARLRLQEVGGPQQMRLEHVEPVRASQSMDVAAVVTVVLEVQDLGRVSMVLRGPPKG